MLVNWKIKHSQSAQTETHPSFLKFRIAKRITRLSPVDEALPCKRHFKLSWRPLRGVNHHLFPSRTYERTFSYSGHSLSCYPKSRIKTSRLECPCLGLEIIF